MLGLYGCAENIKTAPAIVEKATPKGWVTNNCFTKFTGQNFSLSTDGRLQSGKLRFKFRQFINLRKLPEITLNIDGRFAPFFEGRDNLYTFEMPYGENNQAHKFLKPHAAFVISYIRLNGYEYHETLPLVGFVKAIQSIQNKCY